MAEEPVVAKSARVVEEVHSSKDSTERSQQIKDTLRKARVGADPIATDDLHKTR